MPEISNWMVFVNGKHPWTGKITQIVQSDWLLATVIGINPPPRGVPPEKMGGGVSGPLSKNLTLFMTKICNIPTLFMTRPLHQNPVVSDLSYN